MLDSLYERKQRAVRGNRVLIVLRLVLASASLAILLLQQLPASPRSRTASRPTSAAGEVRALVFSPDGKRLYSGGSDATVRIWDPALGAEMSTPIGGQTDVVQCLALSPDGSRLACGSADRTVRILDVRDAHAVRILGALPEQESPLTVLAWSPDGHHLLTGGEENPLRLWDVTASPAVLQKTGGPESRRLTFAAFLPGSREVLTTGLDGKIRLWSAAELALTETLGAHMRAILAAALSPDGSHLVTGGGILSVWDLRRRALFQATEAHTDLITALSFDAKGDQFLSAGRDRKLMLWRLDGLGTPRSFGDHADWVLAAALSPDGKTAATGTADRLVHLWDTATGQEAKGLAGHERTVRTSRPLAGQPAQTFSSLYYQPTYVVAVVVLVLTLFYLLALRRTELAQKLAVLQIAVDIGLISALVYQTGGVDSPFVTLYLVALVAAAFVLSWRGAVAMAACAATLFSLIALAYGTGHIPDFYAGQLSEVQARVYRNLTVPDYVRVLLLPVCGFFAVSGLAGYLSQRLALAHLLYHEILQGLGEGVVIYDQEQRVLFRNEELQQLLKLGPGLEQRPLTELLGPAVQQAAREALASRAPRRVEVTYARSDGLLVPFSVRLLPILEDEGAPRGLTLVLEDITAERKIEEFNKHRERLEAMRQLSATIAHELRNPLASIRGAVQEIARSTTIPESKKILIEIVLSESDRLDQIITDFLQYARVRPPRLAAVDVGLLLEELRLLLQARPEAKDVQIALDARVDVEPFPADAEQLRQAFLNLGLNALQAVEGRPERRISLRLRRASLYQAPGFDAELRAMHPDRPGVLVEIADTGCGMSPEVQERIWEPFFTTKSGGTGLGLATVERLVQGHEGLLHVESRVGEGTALFVWFPADLKAEAGASLTKTSLRLLRL